VRACFASRERARWCAVREALKKREGKTGEKVPSFGRAIRRSILESTPASYFQQVAEENFRAVLRIISRVRAADWLRRRELEPWFLVFGAPPHIFQPHIFRFSLSVSREQNAL